MYQAERHALITDVLRASGRVSVSDLSRRFDVTAETVRRDLDQLEAAGLLRRVHGGAVTADRTSVAESSIAVRQEQRSEAKDAIAHAAFRMLPPTFSGSIVLDAGTTTGRLAELLAEWTPVSESQTLTVITNSVPIAAVLHQSPHLELHLVGGRVRGITSAAVGTSTVDELSRIRPDIAFIGANGLSADFGLSTPDELEGAVKAAIVRGARRVVALVDSTKVGEEALFRFADLDHLDTLITDAALPADLDDALGLADVETVLA